MNYYLLIMNQLSSYYIAGSLSGLLEVTVSHPIDRIKIAVQENTLTGNKMTLMNVIKKLKNMNGFYTGFFPRIIGIIPMRLTYWGTLKSVSKYNFTEKKTLNFMIPGLIAGSVQTIIDNPIEIIKIKYMTSHNSNVTLDIKQLYKGFSPCLIRNIMFAIPVGIITKITDCEYPLLYGAVCGFIGSVISHPFDVIKTDMQRLNGNMTNKNMIQIFYDILKTNPLKFTSGLQMRVLMSCINMGVGFLAFNCITDTLCKFNLCNKN